MYAGAAFSLFTCINHAARETLENMKINCWTPKIMISWDNGDIILIKAREYLELVNCFCSFFCAWLHLLTPACDLYFYLTHSHAFSVIHQKSLSLLMQPFLLLYLLLFGLIYLFFIPLLWCAPLSRHAHSLAPQRSCMLRAEAAPQLCKSS